MGRSETRALKCTVPVEGRYVFVINNVTEPLTLCEVQVFAHRGLLLLYQIVLFTFSSFYFGRVRPI